MAFHEGKLAYGMRESFVDYCHQNTMVAVDLCFVVSQDGAKRGYAIDALKFIGEQVIAVFSAVVEWESDRILEYLPYANVRTYPTNKFGDFAEINEAFENFLEHRRLVGHGIVPEALKMIEGILVFFDEISPPFDTDAIESFIRLKTERRDLSKLCKLYGLSPLPPRPELWMPFACRDLLLAQAKLLEPLAETRLGMTRVDQFAATLVGVE